MKNHPAPVIPTTSDGTLTSSDEKKPIDNYQDFLGAYGEAVVEGIGHVEVTQKLFDYLCKDKHSKALTYGKPGIKVFIAGTMDDVLDDEEMSADEFYVKDIKRLQELAKLTKVERRRK